MKKIVLFIIFFLPITVLAQKRDIIINWSSLTQNKTSVSKVKKPTRLNLLIDNFTLSYNKQWQDDGFAIESSLKVFNVSYSAISTDELNKINKDLIPNELVYSVYSTKARDIIFSSITISPVVNIQGQYKKVVSFSFTYTKSATQFTGGLNSGSNRIPISNSVLATGNWYKFQIDKTGIYRISKSFLSSLGMNTDGINPRNIKIYSSGGKPLPLKNNENLFFDIPENAIQVIGEEDGSFDTNDYVLFYGISTEGYHLENDSNINPYNEESYYFITSDGGPGMRVQEMVEPSGSSNVSFTSFNDSQFHEQDQYSPAIVGRRWYGNRFDIESEQHFEFTFPNIVEGEPMKIVTKVASASESQTSMAISINETSVNPLTFNAIDDPTLLNTRTSTEILPAGSETVKVDLIYNNAGNPSSVGYIDYIRVNAIRQLVGIGGQLSFRISDADEMFGIGEYQISSADQFSQVWDVTDIQSVVAKQNSENQSIFSFKAFLGDLREYVAINPNDFFTPIKGPETVVYNQNLKGTIFNDASGNFKDIDYLIITAPFLLQPALRLANHRKTIDGLNVKVVTTDKIYNEFSSGKQDISAIRNFVRYIYENASSDDKKIKYLCLFGDSSVDYKSRLPNNNNIVPTFHTRPSTSTFSSFMSDDFYGSMDISEGSMTGTDKLDIAVGRILVDEVSLANAMIDKIVNYESKVSYGNWRNNFVIISDDVDEVYEYHRLEVVLDGIGDEVSNEKPFINVKKIHSDAFQQETSAGGNRYPEVNEAIKNAVEVGSLIVNYFGHGGEDGLAKEFVFTKGEAQNLQNKNRYPCIVTVTCEFTKFDNPLRPTAGEFTYWNKEGGAISMITTTRSVSVTLGVTFNEDLTEHLFGFGEDNPETPAEALRITKNFIDNNDRNRRVIFYIGDPAMHLAFPKKSIRLTSLNGVPIGQATDTLKALSKVRIGGEILQENGQLFADYNGVLEAKIFDKDVQRNTLGNDGITENGELLILNFTTLGETIFNGKATVDNGFFEFEFVVPRDIQIPVGLGRVNFYSQKNNELENQTGYNLDLKVGGLNENAPEDNEGPLIQLFMNDESFVSGGITNDSPFLIAKLQDDNGINTASGIGHDITAILDGDEANPFVLNEYYQAEVDDFTKGITNFKLRDLEDGLHTLTLKAWDVYNNSSTADIQFVVANDDELKITRVLNYPNPFVNYTEFWFNHNRPFEPLNVQVQVFTVTGKIVWTKNQIINTDGFLSREIIWDGKDDFGDLIGKGVYVYKISVKSTLTNQLVEKYEKLVIL
ncbi:type IX secretion system sortase PorU [Candidatus Marifrigoribacter sp. Uisw_064]|uniref:type IX secretion system sortase PorU n=1 Tax=Candidatus Marifrigoribacter sp. Uisw_064 TaxID=3230970 RepID=UPI003D3C5743